MVDELRSHQWPSDKILAKLDIVEDRIKTLETVLVGVPGTDSKGLVGDVHHTFRVCDSHEERLSKVEARCDREHGVDPGGKGNGVLEGIAKKVGKTWLFVAAGIGAAIAGAIMALADRFNVY